MAPVPPGSRWHCYACNSYFAEPVKTTEDELPLCPNCASDVVVDRESESEDGWQTDGSAEREREDPPSPTVEPSFPGFFNPPSMTGNRVTEPTPARRRPPSGNPSIGGGFLGMLGSALGMTGNGNGDDERQGGSSGSGPAIRTFTFGSPGSGGMVAGGSISFGGPSRLARGQDGRIPLLDSPDGEATASGGERNPFDQDPRSARQGPDEFDQILAGLLGGPVRQLGGRSGGPTVFTNARPGGAAPAQPDTIEGMMQAMMMHLMHPQDDQVPWFMQGAGLGAGDQGRLGDYVYTQEGFDQVMERMMEAAGQHNHPPPASETVIEGLPRIRLEAENLESIQATNSSCNICFDDFQIGEEVVKIPCKHMFHTPCLVPWLKQNGTCPICRFSLVPDAEARRSTEGNEASSGTQPTSANPFAAVLSGLSGLLGGASGTSSSNQRSNPSNPGPAPAEPTQADDAHQPGEAVSSSWDASPVPNTTPASGTSVPTTTHNPTPERQETPPPVEGPAQYTSGISDYREVMRRREQELRESRTRSGDQSGR